LEYHRSFDFQSKEKRDDKANKAIRGKQQFVTSFIFVRDFVIYEYTQGNKAAINKKVQN
jgi:hypothetical protein